MTEVTIYGRLGSGLMLECYMMAQALGARVHMRNAAFVLGRAEAGGQQEMGTMLAEVACILKCSPCGSCVVEQDGGRMHLLPGEQYLAQKQRGDYWRAITVCCVCGKWHMPVDGAPWQEPSDASRALLRERGYVESHGYCSRECWPTLEVGGE